MAISETLANIIESIVFVSGKAIAIKDIAERLEVKEKEILEVAEELQKKYDENSGINLLIFNKKLQFCSNPKYAEGVASVLNPIRERELTRAMMEVAAIIAYKQPVTRLDLEQVRGVLSTTRTQIVHKIKLDLDIVVVTGGGSIVFKNHLEEKLYKLCDELNVTVLWSPEELATTMNVEGSNNLNKHVFFV